ncbi:MAG: YigZ family protein [Bacteroidota bacterium]
MEKDPWDIYKTISGPSNEILFKDRKSKFYGYAVPINDREEIKAHIELLRKKHHTANHICYAWQLGVENVHFRVNDDGEPSNSAGMPIYGQIKAFGLTNIFVAVIRVFGGTKLGVGGLVQAYKTAAKMALEDSTIVEKVIVQRFLLSFEYALMEKVMRIIKQHKLTISSPELGIKCSYIISVRKKKIDEIISIFSALHQLKIQKLD